jgi:hypothetical protein
MGLDMGTWIIKTGDYKYSVKHDGKMNAMCAAVIAFRDKCPDEAGVLTQCIHPSGEDYYVSTERALVNCGFQFRKKK